VDAERGDPKILADSISTEFSLVRPVQAAPAPPAESPFDPETSIDPVLEAELDPEPEPIVQPEPLSAAVEMVVASERAAEEEGPILETAPPRASPEAPPQAPTLPAGWGEIALVDPRFREPGDTDPRLLTIRLASTGDALRDARRMRRVHGLLLSYPGVDRFVFHVFEASRQYHLEFPNSTTGFCKDLFTQLTLLLGEGMVAVERLRLQ
jgi:hypothetical protein